MDNIKFTPQDILHKQFKEKSIGKGYDVDDVDGFLDDVIKDYDTYNKEVARLQDENERLKAKVDELNRQLEIGSSIGAAPASQPVVSSTTNMEPCFVMISLFLSAKILVSAENAYTKCLFTC